jgi:cation diffusion facilitator family transporter
MTDLAARKQNAAFASIVASAGLTLAKFAAGILSGSLALISEAAHGLLDTGATILTYFAVKAADKPADDEHPYGHGKIEAVAALAETGLLVALALGVLVVAIRRLNESAVTLDPTWPTFVVLIVSIAVDCARWRILSAIARETRSDALAADALHFSSDLVSSSLVLCGLAAARAGFPRADAIAAVGVAVFIGIAGYRLARRTIDTLVDTAPTGLAGHIRALIQAVPGVVGIETIRLRPAGSKTIGEVVILVPRTLTLDRVARIKDAVGASILADLPDAEITVTANPRALDNETVLERILLIAAQRRLAVHHVTVQEIGGQKSVSLDLELDGRMSHGAAHTIASDLEATIVAELGPDIEVETHIEPLEMRELAGQDAGAGRSAEISATLMQRAKEAGAVRDVHSVRVRETTAGLVVNYHCRVDANLSVDEVHEVVDKLDQSVRSDHPAIIRIVGHAEPLPS